MLTTEQIKRLIDSGLTAEQLVIVSEIIDEKQSVIDKKKEVERDRKRKQRGTVTGQSRDSHGTVTGQSPNGFPSDSLSLTPPSSPKENPPKGGQKKGGSFPLPDWMPEQDWEDFRRMRKSIKKPMTHRAEELLIAKLTKMHAKQMNVSDAIQRSIVNCWQDIYELDTPDKVPKGFAKQEPKKSNVLTL